MKLNSISFYSLFFIGIIMICCESPAWMLSLGFAIMVILFHWAHHTDSKEIYRVLGITALQNKFKNNPVIMDMTNE